MAYRVYFAKYYTEFHNEAMKYLVQNLRGLEYCGQGTDPDKGDYIDVFVHVDYQEAKDVLQDLDDCDCLYFEEREE